VLLNVNNSYSASYTGTHRVAYFRNTVIKGKVVI
jgi:hypothetical protein